MEPRDCQVLQSGDAFRGGRGFAEIGRRHAGMVYSVARRITGNAHDAEDVAQACFMELAGKAGTVQSSLGGWLHRAAKFRATDSVRDTVTRKKREREVVVATGMRADTSW